MVISQTIMQIIRTSHQTDNYANTSFLTVS